MTGPASASSSVSLMLSSLPWVGHISLDDRGRDACSSHVSRPGPIRELSEDELDGIAERFLASPFGPAWSDDDLRPLIDDVMAAGSANGIGDPLVWSPGNVRKLLDPRLRALDSLTLHLDRAPDLLRDLIR
jgi:hypothetical protein